MYAIHHSPLSQIAYSTQVRTIRRTHDVGYVESAVEITQYFHAHIYKFIRPFSCAYSESTCNKTYVLIKIIKIINIIN